MTQRMENASGYRWVCASPIGIGVMLTGLFGLAKGIFSPE